MKTPILTSLAVLAAASLAMATPEMSDKSLPERAGDSLKNGAEKTGDVMKSGAQKTGGFLKSAGEKSWEAGRAVGDEGKKIGHSMMNGTRRAGTAISDTFTPDKDQSRSGK